MPSLTAPLLVNVTPWTDSTAINSKRNQRKKCDSSPNAQRHMQSNISYKCWVSYKKAFFNRFGNDEIKWQKYQCALIWQTWSDTDASSNKRAQKLEAIEKVHLLFVLHFPINPPPSPISNPSLGRARARARRDFFAKGCGLLLDGDCLFMVVKEKRKFFFAVISTGVFSLFPGPVVAFMVGFAWKWVSDRKSPKGWCIDGGFAYT